MATASGAAQAAPSAATASTGIDVSWSQCGQRLPSGPAFERARNAATLEGMAQSYTAEGVKTLGLYSTRYQWRQIVGGTLTR